MKKDPITIDVIGLTERGFDHAASSLIVVLEKAAKYAGMIPEDARGEFLDETCEVKNVASFLNSLAGAFALAAQQGRNIQVTFQVEPEKTNVVQFPKQPDVPVEPNEKEVEPPACFRPISDSMPPALRAELEKLIAYIERDGKDIN